MNFSLYEIAEDEGVDSSGFFLKNINGRVYLFLRNTPDIVKCLGIGRPVGFEFFISGEKEQFVLDNRATESATINIFAERTNLQVFAIGFVARPTVVRHETINGTVEFIGS